MKKPAPKVEPVAISREQRAAIGLAALKNRWKREGAADTLPDCPGIVAIAKAACNDDAPCLFPFPNYCPTKKADMEQASLDLASYISAISRIMFWFLVLPSNRWDYKKEATIEESHFWQYIDECLHPREPWELEKLRNWLDTNMPTHAARFDERVWNPWENHRKIIKQKINDLHPWPEASDYFEKLQECSRYLAALQTAIHNNDANAAISLEGSKEIEYKPLSELCAMVGIEYVTSSEKLTIGQSLLCELLRVGEDGSPIGELAGTHEGKTAQKRRNILNKWKTSGIVERLGTRGNWRLTEKCHKVTHG